MSKEETITGIIILNMYYEMYFKHPKKIHWEGIKKEIEQGEFKGLYQKVFFEEIRDSYTEKEWDKVYGLFRRTIKSFNQLGWIKKLSAGSDDIHFVIKESIHRFAELYRKELEEFPKFVEKIKGSIKDENAQNIFN